MSVLVGILTVVITALISLLTVYAVYISQKKLLRTFFDALVGTGVNIMPLLIYTQMSEISVNLQEANALAVVLVFVTTTVVLIYERALAKRF